MNDPVYLQLVISSPQAQIILSCCNTWLGLLEKPDVAYDIWRMCECHLCVTGVIQKSFGPTQRARHFLFTLELDLLQLRFALLNFEKKRKKIVDVGEIFEWNVLK